MANVFEKALAHVFAWEGGYVDHIHDPGGATNFGITRNTLAQWRGKSSIPKDDVKNLSREEAAQIYRVNYWNKVMADDLPPSIAFLVFDAAVNSGPGNAIKALQRSVSALGEPVRIDGAIGPVTLKAVRAVDEEKLLNEYVVRRGVFYGGLRTFTTFGLGWARRLVAGARTANSILLEARKGIGFVPPASAPSLKQPQADKDRLPDELDISRYFFNERGIQAYGTFFRVWGGWMTAGHILTQMLRTSPPFAKGDQVIKPGNLDVALIGCIRPEKQPIAPQAGQKIIVGGFPSGAQTMSLRYGEVFLQRPASNNWIATINWPHEPVVTGMSGGPVCDADTGAVLGVLVTRNAPEDLDADGVLDQNFDFIALHDIWTAVKPATVSV